MNLTRLYEPDKLTDRLLIEDAQPVEWLTAEMHEDIAEGRAGRWATLTGDQLDVVTFTDDYGHRYIYRLGEYDLLRNAFRMEWPD